MVKITQNSWASGQLDPELAGRQDVQRYQSGASLLRNFIPLRRGSIRKRPGTDFLWDVTAYVGTTGGKVNKFRVIPFRYTPSEGYVLVLCGGKGRIYGSDGAFYRDVQGAMPYAADELDDIVYVQCGDVLYLAHGNHPPAEIDHGRTESRIETVWGDWGVSFGTLYQPDVPEGGRVEYGEVAFGMVDGKWEMSYVSTTYPNLNPTEGEVGKEYEVTYWSDNQDSAATSLALTSYSVNDGAAVAASVTARRSKSETTVTTAVDPDKFFYKALPNYVKVEPPTVTKSLISRNFVTTDYRGGVTELKYAATVCALVDGVLYESALHELAPYGAATSEDSPSSGKISTWEGTYFYAPWTESQTVSVDVRLNGGASGQTVREVRLYKYNGTCYGLVGVKEGTWKLGAGATTTVTFVDDYITPDTSSTPLEEKEVFSRDGEYPSCVSLYQQRLVWASSDNSPNRIWMSAAGDFYEHRTHEALQESDPIDFVVPLVDGVGINFLVELGNLFAFTDASEYMVGSNSTSSGISYETIMTTRQSGVGCSRRLPPVVLNNSLLFCERNGLGVRCFNYDIQQNLYGGDDVSVFSSGVFDEKRIVDWAYQQSPESVLWCVLDDGTMASLTYMKAQNVCAWATHVMGGGGKVRGIVQTFTLFGNANGNMTTNEVIVAVERTDAGGAACLTLERMRPWSKTADLAANAVCMDCVKLGDHSAEGMVYVAAADASGWPFACTMETMQPVLGDAVGNAQFDVKNAHVAHLRVKNSVGGRVRAAEAGDALAVPLKTTTLPTAGVDGLLAFETKDESVVLNGANSRDGRIVVEQDAPWPFQVLLLEQDFEVEEGDHE